VLGSELGNLELFVELVAVGSDGTRRTVFAEFCEVLLGALDALVHGFDLCAYVRCVVRLVPRFGLGVVRIGI
jgi:hypothetical protein